MEKKIVIYGAGNDCINFLNGYSAIKKYIESIVDGDDRKVGTEICGFTIKEKESIRDISEEKMVAISSRKYFDEIEKTIQKLNPKVTIRRLDEGLAAELLPVIGKCNMCDSEIRNWLATGQDNKTLYPIIGNGYRLSRCPYCGGIDRHRWLYWVLKNRTEIFNTKCKILHLAPEGGIKETLKQQHNVNYYTGDIQQGRAEYIVDITDIQFKDGLFDYIIANHVLEHIADEKKAISEMKRCLKKDGIIILSFPICMETKTIEDERYNTDELRKKYYGQEDHVRLYGSDFKERLEEQGLHIECCRPNEILDKEIIEKHNLIWDDVVMLCTKGEMAKSL